VRETVRDVAFLHNEQLFAVAQKKYFLDFTQALSHISISRQIYQFHILVLENV
jgi:hypothetical protein